MNQDEWSSEVDYLNGIWTLTIYNTEFNIGCKNKYSISEMMFHRNPNIEFAKMSKEMRYYIEGIIQ